uniref:Peptidase A2 domain-containing protein n=1 Tax=Myotis myotis TaxID=51298 RepID=A0A7J7VI73_MYOMY|nr:hypothetical protein mMyoMyo1_008356 [Myotis myotis]
MQITPGQRIAQILFLPYVQQGEAINRKRGMQGFGSSGIYWIQEISKTHPMINLRIEGKQFRGLVDTGVDVSIISKEFWTPSWSTAEAMGSVKGVGAPDDTQHSAAVLRWRDEEGQTGWFQPYVISGIAVNLWDRDVLEGLQACIVTGKGKPLITQIGYQPFRSGHC